ERRPLAIWGRGADEVYVSLDGALLRFDGRGWHLEPTPIPPQVDPAHTDPVEGERLFGLLALAGDSQVVYAADWDHVWRKRERRWEALPAPREARRAGCLIGAAAMLGDTVLFLGQRYAGERRPCLLAHHDGRWTVLDPPDAVLRRNGVYGGQTQPDGSVLFWRERNGTAAEVLEVAGGRFLRYSFPGLHSIRGAAARGDYLYLAGSSGERGMVIRVPRRGAVP
ncbi:MAG: hypothetical protein KY467_04845, partial [Gemmatimonadetes bacterium]|nr:hypothetical protein [Gemmatimonadota bacterium]